MKELWGCVVVAQLAAQAKVRMQPDLATSAVVVMEGVRPMERVCSVNVRARTMGLREGMTRVEVETFADVVVLTRSAAEEVTAQRVLFEAMSRFSPRIEAKICNADWECVVDLAGTERLLGDSAAVGAGLVRGLEELGFVGFCCLAANADAGLSVARFGAWTLGVLEKNTRFLPQTVVNRSFPAEDIRVRVMERGKEGWGLCGLPVGVLRLADEMQERFAIWGIRTLGELAELPETALIVRVGQVGKTLRLRARGELTYLMRQVEEEAGLEEIRELEEPVETLEPLLFLTESMLELLLKRVVGRALALASVSVSFGLEIVKDRVLGVDGLVSVPLRRDRDGLEFYATKEFSRTLRPAVATVDRRLLMKMLQLDLEAHPAPGAVVRVRVAAEAGDASRIQLGLFAPQMPEPTRFEDTHARLISLVGEQNVGRVRLLDTHAEEGFVLERFRLPSAEYKVAQPRTKSALPVTALRRIRPVLQVRVSMKGQQILGFWLDGRRFEVVRCFGPWRSSGAWWAGHGWSEDSWDLATRCEADGEVMVCLLGHDLVRDDWSLAGVYD